MLLQKSLRHLLLAAPLLCAVGSLTHAQSQNQSQNQSQTQSQNQSVTRFTHEQLSFTLQPYEEFTDLGGLKQKRLSPTLKTAVPCHHTLLSHVPWWTVRCGSREYTVNTWLQVLEDEPNDRKKVTFMFDVSEGVKSSGEKLVQFRSHLTSLTTKHYEAIKTLNSELDVLNGQASLIIEARIQE